MKMTDVILYNSNKAVQPWKPANSGRKIVVDDILEVEVKVENSYRYAPPPPRAPQVSAVPTSSKGNTPWGWIAAALLALAMILGTFLFLGLYDRGGDSLNAATSGDESYIVAPNVAFTSGPAPQLVTERAEVSLNGVLIHYRWIHAPEGPYTFAGEVWAFGGGGNERMIFHATGPDTGTIFVPVSDWTGLDHVRVVATGPSQKWQECGGFIPFAAPANAAPAPQPAAPTPDTSGWEEEKILDSSVSWD